MTMMIWHVKANGDPLPETTRFRQSMYTVHSKQYESIRIAWDLEDDMELFNVLSRMYLVGGFNPIEKY